MEINKFEFEEGNKEEFDWLQYKLFKELSSIPQNVSDELVKNYENQKYHNVLIQFRKHGLIFYFVGSKIFFINKTNLPKIFKKTVKSKNEDYLIFDFKNEIQYIKVVDLQVYDETGFDLLDLKEKFLFIFLKNNILIFSVDNFVKIIETILKNENHNNQTESEKILLNNCVNLEIKDDICTNSMFVYQENLKSQNYEIFFINYSKKSHINLTFSKDLIGKDKIPKLKYFSLKKSLFKDFQISENENRINSSNLNITDLNFDLLGMEFIKSNLFVFNIDGNLHFYYINLKPNLVPKLIPATYEEENNHLCINFRESTEIDFAIDREELIFDIASFKLVKENCLFLVAFYYKKEEEEPAKTFFNVNIGINMELSDSSEIINLKFTIFNDIFFPDSDYPNLITKPVIEISDVLYNETFIVSNSHEKLLQNFVLIEEIESYSISYSEIDPAYAYFLTKNQEFDKDAKMIGTAIIDFKFQGYEDEKNVADLWIPYLIMILDNFGRISFAQLFCKHLQECPLRNDEDKPLLKGYFQFNIYKEPKKNANFPEISSLNSIEIPFKKDFPPMNQSNIFGEQIDIVPNFIYQKKDEKIKELNLPHSLLGEIQNQILNLNQNQNQNPNPKERVCNTFEKIEDVSTNILFKKNDEDVEEKLEEKLKREGIILQENKPSEMTNLIATEKDKQNKVFSNLINQFNQNNKENVNLIDINPKIPKISNKLSEKIQIDKKNTIIQNFNEPEPCNDSNSDSEFVKTRPSEIKNNQYKIIYQSEKKNSRIKERGIDFENQVNRAEETDWYTDKIEEYKKKIDLINARKEERLKKLSEDLAKEEKEFKNKTDAELNSKIKEINLEKEEFEKNQKDRFSFEEKKMLLERENLEKEKIKNELIMTELKEKIFDESKKNIFCNLQIYKEIIKDKIDDFEKKVKQVGEMEKELTRNNKFIVAIENEIEKYICNKDKVQETINSYYNNEYEKEIEYYSERFMNVVKILIKNEKDFPDDEIEEFIFNNQMSLSSENRKKVMGIKQKFEKMRIFFQEKIIFFSKFLEESFRLCEVFSNNEKLNELLDLANKYIGSISKFNQKMPFERTLNQNSLSFNFNNLKGKISSEFDLNQYKSISEKFSNVDRETHTKIFEDVMRQYEIEFNSLSGKYNFAVSLLEKLKNEIEDKKTSGVLKQIPINSKIENPNKNKSSKVFSGNLLKSLYKNNKKIEENINSKEEKFFNIDAYMENKGNLGSYLNLSRPNLSSFDQEGQDFFKVFIKYKKNNQNENILKQKENDEKLQQELKSKELKKYFSNTFADLKQYLNEYKESKLNLEKVSENAKKQYDKTNPQLKLYEEKLEKMGGKKDDKPREKDNKDFISHDKVQNNNQISMNVKDSRKNDNSNAFFEKKPSTELKIENKVVEKPKEKEIKENENENLFSKYLLNPLNSQQNKSSEQSILGKKEQNQEESQEQKNNLGNNQEIKVESNQSNFLNDRNPLSFGQGSKSISLLDKKEDQLSNNTKNLPLVKNFEEGQSNKAQNFPSFLNMQQSKQPEKKKEISLLNQNPLVPDPKQEENKIQNPVGLFSNVPNKISTGFQPSEKLEQANSESKKNNLTKIQTEIQMMPNIQNNRNSNKDDDKQNQLGFNFNSLNLSNPSQKPDEEKLDSKNKNTLNNLFGNINNIPKKNSLEQPKELNKIDSNISNINSNSILSSLGNQDSKNMLKNFTGDKTEKNETNSSVINNNSLGNSSVLFANKSNNSESNKLILNSQPVFSNNQASYPLNNKDNIKTDFPSFGIIPSNTNANDLIPKTGFGQSSSLSSLSAAPRPVVGTFGFGKNLSSESSGGFGGFASIAQNNISQSGFAALAPKPGGFFTNQNNNIQGTGINQNQGGFLQNIPKNINNVPISVQNLSMINQGNAHISPNNPFYMPNNDLGFGIGNISINQNQGFMGGNLNQSFFNSQQNPQHQQNQQIQQNQQTQQNRGKIDYDF